MAQLPQEFLTRMQDMLGDEFDAFLTSYDAPRTAGLLMKVSSNRKLAFMLFRELLEKSKGSLFDIHCGMWTSIND